jgi:3-oxoacyl-[acyl-carrier-protein] synthase III
MANLSKTAAIVGVAESDELGVVPGASALGLHLQAAANALADAGIERSEVDL